MPIKRLLIRNHRSRFLMILLVVEIGALFPAILAAQWPMQGYNARRTGSCPYPGPITSEVKWFYDFGVRLQDNASPIVGPDHTIYQITEFKYLQGQGVYVGLFAINPNGTLKWQAPASGRLAPALSPDGSRIYASSFLTDTIMAIKTEDGSTDWEFPLPIDNQDQSYSSLAVDTEGTIYVCTRLPAAVYALNPDGTVKWSYVHPNSISLGIEGPPSVGPDGSVYVQVNTVGLVALDSDGLFKWSNAENLGSYGWPAFSVLPDGTIISPGDGYTTQIIAYNPDGSFKWRRADVGNGGYLAGVAVSLDSMTIYAGRSGGIVYALDAQTGETKWSSVVASGEKFSGSPALASNGIIYIMGTQDGMVGHIYAVLEIDGSLLWQSELNSPALFWGPQSPALDSDGTLYAAAPGTVIANGGLSGRLYAFKFTANQAPAVSISSPTDHSVFDAGTSLMIQAQASDADGTVQKVEFLADGNKLGEDNDGSNGFSFLWNNIPAADHDLTARAVDNYGIKTSSAAVRIILARPPEIHLNRTALSFGAPQGGIPTAVQPVLITNSGGGALAWTAVPSAAWITATPGSGTGDRHGRDRRGRDGAGAGNISGTVAFSDPNATNSPRPSRST